MRELTFTEAAREGLAEEMERDPMVFVVGEGVGERGGNFATTVGLYDRFGPERLRDTPIAERGFTGLCTGAALGGARPVVDYMFFDFALDALGEIINQTAKIQYMSNGRLKMPIVLRGCVGIGSSAATHHPAATTRCLPTSPACGWWRRPRRATRRGCSRRQFGATIRWSSWSIAACCHSGDRSSIRKQTRCCLSGVRLSAAPVTA